MKKKSNKKYIDFEYSDRIKSDLNFKLDYEDNIKFNLAYNELLNNSKAVISPYIAEDVFKMAYILKYPTTFIAYIYDLDIRTIQLWLCDLKINKDSLKNDIKYKKRKSIIKDFEKKLLDKNKEIIGNTYSKWTVLNIDYYLSYIKKETYLICRCKCINKTIRSVLKTNLVNGYSNSCGCKLKQSNLDIDKDMLDDYDYCLYRFLDCNKNVLYIGKCTKTYGRNNNDKYYFIKDRLLQHYSKSSKQLPKSLYLNTKYIEITFPDVKSNSELEKMETELISYYERVKLQCNYNLDLPSGVKYINEDNLKWTLYNEKTDEDMEILKRNYGYEKIPPVETINERLRAMLWLKENNKLKEIEKNDEK